MTTLLSLGYCLGLSSVNLNCQVDSFRRLLGFVSPGSGHWCISTLKILHILFLMKTHHYSYEILNCILKSVNIATSLQRIHAKTYLDLQSLENLTKHDPLTDTTLGHLAHCTESKHSLISCLQLSFNNQL